MVKKLSQVVLCYFDLSHIVIGIWWDNRYLGLFGDHIVPAILYRCTSELIRPDLVNAKGKPLITKARLKAVWTRLNPQVIPSCPWLYTYITGYPGISLANDAAPGLLVDSPALPVQPGGPV